MEGCGVCGEKPCDCSATVQGWAGAASHQSSPWCLAQPIMPCLADGSLDRLRISFLRRGVWQGKPNVNEWQWQVIAFSPCLHRWHRAILVAIGFVTLQIIKESFWHVIVSCLPCLFWHVWFKAYLVWPAVCTIFSTSNTRQLAYML